MEHNGNNEEMMETWWIHFKQMMGNDEEMMQHDGGKETLVNINYYILSSTLNNDAACKSLNHRTQLMI